MSHEYEIYAVKYAHHDRPARDNFLFGDPHEVNMPLDYFVWAIVGEDRTICVDTGFDAAMGAKRGREMFKVPAEGLKAIGIDHENVQDVVVSHMHYDHVGNHTLYPNATFHVQEREMAFTSGPNMCHDVLRFGFEADDVALMIHRLFEGRLRFHDGTSELAPGITLHHVGGHTDGLQVVRVRTKRGWVVLASDASHLYANMEEARPYPAVYNIGDTLAGFQTIKALAESPDHVVPGHDPLVLEKYPAPNKELEGWVVRLDAPPK